MTYNFKAPAIPLICVDPHFSIWSFDDKLTDGSTRHWSGVKNNILGLIEIDKKLYKFMGVAYPDNFYPEDRFDVLNQISLEITPMQTIYEFECDEIRLKLKFTSPLFYDDLDVMSRPVSYLDYEITSNDGKEHNVEIAFMPSCEIAGDTPEGKNVKIILNDNSRVTFGAGEKDVLLKSCDMLPCGYGYFTMVSNESGETFVSSELQIHAMGFYDPTPNLLDNLSLKENPHVVKSSAGYFVGWKKSYLVTKDITNANFLCFGFNDIFSIEYFNRKIKAYCFRDGLSFDDILKLSITQHNDIVSKAEKVGKSIIEMGQTISEEYSHIISLAYRQIMASHKLTWCDGEMQYFSKECASNGCISTVDITYPSIPMFLLFNPKLLEAMLTPIMKFARSDEWGFDFAPHDLGQYPKANRQVYGRLNESTSKADAKSPLNKSGYVHRWQMPVEESSNMLICVNALCRVYGDYSYAEKNLDLLKKWADYLISCGFDLESQLCTDDFAGHLAHNCNLSIKSIIAIASFGDILNHLGKDGKVYFDSASVYANDWKTYAIDGDHYKLAFDKVGTWGLKYNLIWDKLFGFDLFGDEVIKKELSYYEKMMETYGVPLDSRCMQGKTDWQMWVAALGMGTEFEQKTVQAMHRFLEEGPIRAPFGDWIDCDTGKKHVFQHRSVQGGLFINLLARDERFNN